jgi:predicted small metal-binding protein
MAHTSHEQYSIKCSDAGFKSCNWQTTANSESELMKKVEQHGRESHHIQQLSPDQRRQVQGAIHRQAA